jgi:dihydrofolate synthase/folylpolyglutamate synthase
VHLQQQPRRRGLAQVQWPGRFQRFGDDLVIDGAHNPPAAVVLLSAWRAAFGSAKAQLIFGAMNDKDVPALLHILRGISDEVWLVPVKSSRSASVDVLRGMAAAAGFSAAHADDLPVALAAARAKGPTLVAGSLFLAGETLALLQGQDAPLPSDQ